MIFTLAFLAVLAAIAAWWLVRQGLADKPWLETGVAGETAVGAVIPPPIHAAKIGLGVFIAVASSLLVLMVSAYSMRMQMADWSPPPQPRLLWANTGVLVLASLALHRAVAAARRGERPEARNSLLAATAAGVIFLIGQVLAWRELAGLGYLPANNPADAFFYLITAAHGLHVLGGLAALARTIATTRAAALGKLRLSVELCATYWHFLLLAWLLLFSMLAFSPSFAWFYALCTAPFR
jgi:cytochrome c oxidase subunit 3